MPGMEAAYDIIDNLNRLFARNADGMIFDNGVDPCEDSEYIREVLRPAVIKEDVRLMEQRKRVSLILKSAAFRRQLDAIIKDQLSIASNPSDLPPGHVQQLKLSKAASPLVSQGMNHKKSLNAKGLWPIVPVNDVSSLQIPDLEKQSRCELASLCRMLDLHAWVSKIEPFSHVSLRVRRANTEILFNPCENLFSEVSAYSLPKVNINGDFISSGTNLNKGNQVGNSLKLHLGIYNQAKHIRAIIHLNNSMAVSIANSQNNLLPLSREAIIIGPVSKKLEKCADLRDVDNLNREFSLILKQEGGNNTRLIYLPESSEFNGILVLGTSVEEAWFYANNVMHACECQLSLSSLSLDDLWIPTQDECQSMRTAFIKQATCDNSQEECSIGELEWEALIRHLDNAGYRTGHFYRREHWSASVSGVSSSPKIKHRGDVEIPPCCVSSEIVEPHSPDPTTEKSSLPFWMLSPHQYARFEMQDYSGTDDDLIEEETDQEKSVNGGAATGGESLDGLSDAPSDSADKSGKGKRRFRRRKVCSARWVAKGGYTPTSMLFRTHMSTLPAPGMTAANTAPNVFAPQGRNSKEYRNRQRQLKKKYFEDETTAGPSSQRLDGFTVEELMYLKERGYAKISTDGRRLILMAATSQAIIEKDARNFTPLLDSDLVISANPFERITDDDLEMYKQEIEIKNNPELARIIKEQQDREEKERKLAELDKKKRPQLEVNITEKKVVPAAAVVSSVPQKTLKSDTSTYEDTEKEGTDTGAEILSGDVSIVAASSSAKDKKKKRRFKMPSFSRKKKD